MREPRALRDMRLLVVSHVTHYAHGGRLHAFGAYAREIDLWAALFREVRIAAPRRTAPPPGDAAPFEAANVSLVPQRETGGTTAAAKLRQLAALPALVAGLHRAMHGVDAVHVRCPGNLGLLGAVLAPLHSRRLVAKYAGQWTPYPGEPPTERLQRALLRSAWWRGPVTVYGAWPDQPPHVVPFFTAMLTEAQVARARRAIAARTPGAVPRVLFVGRLDPVKNVDVLLRAAARLAARGTAFELALVGDGSARPALETLATALGLRERVRFHGAVPLESVPDFYERADVLVLASEAEGWPKAIAEGMAFGLVCIGSDRGLVPQMLGEGRGFTVPPRDEDALVARLGQVLDGLPALDGLRARAAAWGQRRTREELQRAIGALLEERWGLAGAGA